MMATNMRQTLVFYNTNHSYISLKSLQSCKQNSKAMQEKKLCMINSLKLEKNHHAESRTDQKIKENKLNGTVSQLSKSIPGTNTSLLKPQPQHVKSCFRYVCCFFRLKNFVELEIWAGPKERLPSIVSPTGGVLVHHIRQDANNNVVKCPSLQNPSTDLAETWPQSLPGKGQPLPLVWSWSAV